MVVRASLFFPLRHAAQTPNARLQRPFALYCHNTAGALPVRVSIWAILNRPTQPRTGAASSAMNGATRTIKIERTMTTPFGNTELAGELNEVHCGLKGGETVVCIFFWVSFVFSPDLAQVVFSFSIWSPIYFLWFEKGLFVFFW